VRLIGGMLLVGWGLVASAPTEKVAIRVEGGRFLRAMADGSLRAERFLPTEEELFDLEPREGGHVTLKTPAGRLLVAQGPGGRRLQADSPRAEPGDRETFQVVPVEGNSVGLRARGCRGFVGLAAGAPGDAAPPASDKPRPDEAVEVFRTAEIPAALRGALSAALGSLVAEELSHKEYDKTRSRKVERFLDLPAPTLRDPGRTRPRRVLSMVEEYRVQARLDGAPEIQLTGMPALGGYQDRGLGLLMFAVQARVPTYGRVGYKIREAVSASTGFRTAVRLALVGEVRLQRSGSRLSLGSPELREMHVELDGLRLSNDLLNAAREPIGELVNHELARNEERIRQKANKALAKAMQSRELEHPLLRFLSLP